MSFSQSSFSAALKTKSDMSPLVVLFVLHHPSRGDSRPPTSKSTAADPPLVVLHASSDLSRPGAAAAVQPPCTAWQA